MIQLLPSRSKKFYLYFSGFCWRSGGGRLFIAFQKELEFTFDDEITSTNFYNEAVNYSCMNVFYLG